MSYSARLRFLLLPAVAIAVGTAVGYSLLAWLLFQVLRLPRPSDDWLSYWLPAILCWLPLLQILRPRTKTLAPLRNGNEPGFALLMLAWAFTVFMTMFATTLTLSMTSSLVHVRMPSEVLAHPDADFFQIDQLYADKSASGQFADSTISGRAGDKLTFRLFFVTPLRDNAHTKTRSGVWLTSFGADSLSTRDSEADRHAVYGELYRRTLKEFEKRDFSQASYFEREQPSALREGFVKAMQQVSAAAPENIVILQPKYEPFASRLSPHLWGLGIGMTIFVAIHAVFFAFVRIEHGRLAEYRHGRKASVRLIQNALAWVGAPHARISKVLAAVLISVYLYTVAITGNPIFIPGNVLAELGANVSNLTRSGEWWRLLTAMALHGGLMHIVMNAGILLLAGFALEPLVGSWRFLVCFIAGGIFSGLASMTWNAQGASVGASGAIFALVGYLFALASTDRLVPELRQQIWTVFGGITAATLLLGLTGLLGNVDNAAHFGGLFTGYVIGWLLLPPHSVLSDANDVY